jgi:hypothetical protein
MLNSQAIPAGPAADAQICGSESHRPDARNTSFIVA